ncbi:hypothetical protein [Mycolicibacter kumamotonensis]|nr:hypothetical protein [Mycolicibacter kumamotonensis]
MASAPIADYALLGDPDPRDLAVDATTGSPHRCGGFPHRRSWDHVLLNRG